MSKTKGKPIYYHEDLRVMVKRPDRKAWTEMSCPWVVTVVKTKTGMNSDKEVQRRIKMNTEVPLHWLVQVKSIGSTKQIGETQK